MEHYDEIGNRASVEWEADDIHNKRYGDWEANVKAESSVISMALAAEDDDLLYGVTPVLRALESMRRGRFVQLFAQERGRCGTNGPARKADNDAAVERIMRIVTSRGIEVQRVSKGDLNVLSHNRPHQGLVLQAGKLDYIELKKMRDVQPDARNEKGGVPCYLVLDEVSDPQNVGALLRSALFLGADGVIVCKRNSCGLTAVVSKASAGALEVMDVHGVASMPRFLKAAGESGWRIVGMGLGERAMGCKTVALERPTLVVVGNEGKGLRPLVRDKCDVIVRIEGGGDGEVDSLNVSVAGAVALYQLLSGVEELSVALDGVKSSVSGVEGVDGRAVEE